MVQSRPKFEAFDSVDKATGFEAERQGTGRSGNDEYTREPTHCLDSDFELFSMCR